MTIEETLIEMEKNESDVKMNIFQKLTYIQNDLLEINIPKNGRNKFGGFSYYELDDLLPPILKLCKEYGCTLYFNFPLSNEGECKKGVLNLINWEDKEDCIKVEVPFPKLEKLPKMNFAQSSGTYQTYMKRYLILHTFDIVEGEVIDSGFLENSTQNHNGNTRTTPKKSSNENKKNNDINEPACLSKVISKCHELHGEKECDGKLLNKVSLQMFNKKELTLDERKEIFNYVKTLKK